MAPCVHKNIIIIIIIIIIIADGEKIRRKNKENWIIIIFEYLSSSLKICENQSLRFALPAHQSLKFANRDEASDSLI
jgi:hypothetical protein